MTTWALASSTKIEALFHALFHQTIKKKKPLKRLWCVGVLYEGGLTLTVTREGYIISGQFITLLWSMCVRPKVSLSLLRFCWVLDYSWSVLLVKAEDATSIHRKKCASATAQYQPFEPEL